MIGRTTLLGGMYRLVFGALYGVLCVIALFSVDFLISQETSTAAPLVLLVMLVYVAVGIGLGAPLGAIWGVAGGLVEGVLLLILSGVYRSAGLNSHSYRLSGVALSLLVMSIAHWWPILGITSSGPNMLWPSLPLLLFALGVPLLLAHLSLVHIGYLISGWAMNPPEKQARSLF